MAIESNHLLPAPIVGSYIPDLERMTVTQQLGIPNGLSSREVVIPDGHWWRIISAEAVFISGATAGNRTFEFTVSDAQSQIVLDIYSPAQQSNNSTITYQFGPDFQPAQAPTGVGATYQQFQIPDLIWPFGYKLRMLHVAFGGDSWGANPAPAFLVEDYAPSLGGNDGEIFATSIPTPLLV